MLIGASRTILNRLRGNKLHRAEVSARFLVYGSRYGGWPIIDGSIGQDSIIYSFGVGTDISFDVGLIEKFGSQVWAFDPTPRCVEWIANQKLPDRFSFRPIGISNRSGVVEFFPPENEAHVSFSIRPSGGKEANCITASVDRLASIMEDLGHQTIDVLKLDIEGFEYKVVNDLLETDIRPNQVLIEFHHNMYGIKASATLEAVDKLKGAGYQLFFVSNTGREYGFCHSKGFTK